MSKEWLPEETIWTVEVDDNVFVKHDGKIVSMPSTTDLRMIGLEMGSKVALTIEAMPKFGAKTLKMVISWE